MLVAVGRRPQTAGLGLETTRARLAERGFIEVDERGRTADPHVWAVGDVTGEPMLAHRAMRQGKVAAEAIAGPARRVRQRRRPRRRVHGSGGRLVRSHRDGRPQAAGQTVKVARFPWAASGRAATLGRSDGVTKLVVDPDTRPRARRGHRRAPAPAS